ncbi:MAG: CdaR family protein [Desulfocapsaceae bacterium]|nr:CdaR family protein [Desulfocapsaceae bacterium]
MKLLDQLNKSLRVDDIRRFQEMWPKDWTLRFISLILAIVLWYFVGGDDTVDKNVLVPLEVINLPRDLVISNQFKREIEVTISGPRSQVLKIEKGDITKQVDLAQAVPGTMVIKNEIHLISVPRGVKVLRTQPDSIIFSMDKLIQKQLAVKPTTKGNLAPHYLLQTVRMKPETISITGPQAVLAQLDALHTQTIDISGMNQSTQLQIPLDLKPALLDLIGETSVTADLVIAEETVEKHISGVPIELNDQGGRQITPSTVTVTALLPRSLVRENKDLQSLFNAMAVDEGEAGQMTVKVVPMGNSLNSVKIVKVEPMVVTYSEEKPKLPPMLKQDQAPRKE